MKTKSIILTLVLFSALTLALRREGNCVDRVYSTKSDFDLQQYAGNWLRLVRDFETPYGQGDCVSATYIPNVQRINEAFAIN